MLPRRSLPTLFLLFSVASVAVFAQARTPYTPEQQPAPGWTPPSLSALARHATFHTNFTFNRAMLQFANKYMDDGDAETARAVDKLNAISVYSYHFSAPGLYDPAALARVRADYAATGWKHMTTARAAGDPFSSGQTDIWISLSHAQVTGMTVLLAGAKDIDLITLTGNLSPLDLLHLRGHFGIPRFDADGLGADAGAPPPPPDTQEEPPEAEPNR